jgi:hypothetical protein
VNRANRLERITIKKRTFRTKVEVLQQYCDVNLAYSVSFNNPEDFEDFSIQFIDQKILNSKSSPGLHKMKMLLLNLITNPFSNKAKIRVGSITVNWLATLDLFGISYLRPSALWLGPPSQPFADQPPTVNPTLSGLNCALSDLCAECPNQSMKPRRINPKGWTWFDFRGCEFVKNRTNKSVGI